MPKALITGITGQDGSYLAEFLIKQGYEVLGMVRRTSTINFDRIRHFQDQVTLVQGDLLDQVSLLNILEEHKPDEVYNLAAQSFVPTSWTQPVLTGEFTALGVTRILDAVRLVNPKIRFYQASSSEMFGKVREVPQSEATPFYPRSPYGVAKVYGHWITINYRESYNLFACSGILFNHESPRRGETFVTRKITRGLANIAQGLEKCLFMGNLNALRDWGHAKDYVRMQWMMLQQDAPEDFVIATGVQYSVRDFIRWSAAELGITLCFERAGEEELGVIERIVGDAAPALAVGDVIVRVDSRYFRPTEVETLLGDPAKAKERLGWVPEISVQQMCAEMVAEDLKVAKRHAFLKQHGHAVSMAVEA